MRNWLIRFPVTTRFVRTTSGCQSLIRKSSRPAGCMHPAIVSLRRTGAQIGNMLRRRSQSHIWKPGQGRRRRLVPILPPNISSPASHFPNSNARIASSACHPESKERRESQMGSFQSPKALDPTSFTSEKWVRSVKCLRERNPTAPPRPPPHLWGQFRAKIELVPPLLPPVV